MKCVANNCNGDVDMGKPISINVQQGGATHVFACNKCGKLHRSNGAEALNCTEHSLYLGPSGCIREGRKDRGYPVH